MHPFWEILLICAGSGSWRHGNRTASIAKNDLLLIGPEQQHQFAASQSSGVTICYAGFTFTPDDGIAVDVPANLAGIAGIAGIRNELRAIADSLAGSGNSIRYGTRRRLFHVLGQLVEAITAVDDDRDAPTREQVLVERAMRFMEQHVHRPLSVSDVAEVFYLSPHYFADLFRQFTGTTVKQYHETVRLRKAALLLRDRTRSITEISRALGYSSVHYFSRRFKRHYKVAPSVFRG
jgi:AraC-like DNA-binding protein